MVSNVIYCCWAYFILFCTWVITFALMINEKGTWLFSADKKSIIFHVQFKMTKMKHAWFPVTLRFVLTLITFSIMINEKGTWLFSADQKSVIFHVQFKMTKKNHAWFPVTPSFVLTHSLDKSVDECVSTKLRVAGNHACFMLVILNCISLYTHVYRTLSYNFPQLIFMFISIVMNSPNQTSNWKGVVVYQIKA